MVVCAPGHILKSATDRIKIDKRDAIRLARLLSAGELHEVQVPAPDEEQLRDLVRSRENLRLDLMRCRHRIGKFLLRREISHRRRPGGRGGRPRCSDWYARAGAGRSLCTPSALPRSVAR